MDLELKDRFPCNFAVWGDVHGQMESARNICQRKIDDLGLETIDFVLQVGDFEPHRDGVDLSSMAAPNKHRKMGDYYKFHEGQLEMPWPIIFIGGNHEPWLLLDDQQGEGFTISDNFHFFGRSDVQKIGPLTVAGMSGIYREETFKKPHWTPDMFPYKSNKEWIGFNRDDVKNLVNLKDDFENIDILLTHDWPADLVTDIDHQTSRPIGNPVAKWVRKQLNPTMMYCGHMHTEHRDEGIHCLAKVPDYESVAIYRAIKENDKIKISEIKN